MNEQDRIERGARAERLLADPLLDDGFKTVREAIIAKIEQTPIRDRDGAHELRLMLKLLADVKLALAQAVNDGKVVAFNQRHREAASPWDKFKNIVGVRR